MQENVPSKFPTRFLWGGCAAVLIIWVLTPLIVKSVVSKFFPTPNGGHGLEQFGQFGDLFGSINALFSGLAFVGVVTAIRLQHLELRAQLQEFRKSADATSLMVFAQAYKTAHDILQNEKTVIARGFVFENLLNKGKLVEKWSKEEIAAAEQVCRSFDAVAIMIKHEMLPAEVIADNWGDALRKSWISVKPLVFEYRQKRSAPEYWDDFEKLATTGRVTRKPDQSR